MQNWILLQKYFLKKYFHFISHPLLINYLAIRGVYNIQTLTLK